MSKRGGKYFRILDQDSSTAVIFHKMPAIWDDIAKKSDDNFLTDSAIRVVDKDYDNSFIEFFTTNDIYYQMVKKIAEDCGIDELHVVFGFDTNESGNWRTMPEDGHVEIEDGVNFWRISSPDSLSAFINADVYFMRGNYNHLYGKIFDLCTKNPLSIFYPATAQMFPSYSRFINRIVSQIDDDELDSEYVIDRLSQVQTQAGGPAFKKLRRKSLALIKNEQQSSDEIIESARKIFCEFVEMFDSVRREKNPTNYSFVLFDDILNKGELHDVHPQSTLLHFNKPASSRFKLLNLGERKYDFVFSATPLQKTKNHDILIAFIEYLEKHGINCNLLYIGDTGEMPKLTKVLEADFEHVHIESPGFVDVDELVEYYNQAKVSLLFSGRDCNPRVIAESMKCGCHNVVLDIISDGSSFIKANPILGTVIETSTCEPLFSSGRSISIIPNDAFFEHLVNISMKSYDHFSIGILTENVLSLNNSFNWPNIVGQFSQMNTSTPKSL